MLYLITGFLSFVTSLGITYALIPMFHKLHVTDVPSNRKIHTRVVPSGGGVAIAFTLIAALVVYYFRIDQSFSLLYLISSIAIMSIVSFMDDVKTLSPLTRILLHIVGVFLMFSALEHQLSLKVYIFFFISTLAFVNFYNFMDGLDGLAASGGVHIGVSILILSLLIPINPQTQYVALVLACACLGFLVLNWTPAKIFMGDAGSIVIGTVSAWLLLDLVFSGHFITAAIIPAYLMSDAGVTMLMRLFKGEKIWLPHLKHFYQKEFKRCDSHRSVVLKIIGINFVLMLLSVMSVYLPVLAFVLAAVVVGGVLWRWGVEVYCATK